jgi:hypothetical protein
MKSKITMHNQQENNITNKTKALQDKKKHHCEVK